MHPRPPETRRSAARSRGARADRQPESPRARCACSSGTDARPQRAISCTRPLAQKRAPRMDRGRSGADRSAAQPRKIQAAKRFRRPPRLRNSSPSQERASSRLWSAISAPPSPPTSFACEVEPSPRACFGLPLAPCRVCERSAQLHAPLEWPSAGIRNRPSAGRARGPARPRR
jgi:hypothetical protein